MIGVQEFRACRSQTSMKSTDLRLVDSGQAKKGLWWIPRHTEAKKDVVTDDMRRGVGSKH
jgi:hypothetical protein